MNQLREGIFIIFGYCKTIYNGEGHFRPPLKQHLISFELAVPIRLIARSLTLANIFCSIDVCSFRRLDFSEPSSTSRIRIQLSIY